MKIEGAVKLRIIIWSCMGLLLLLVGILAWRWGRIEFHAQRLGTEDREAARNSELALIAFGEKGQSVVRNFLLKKLNIKLPPLSVEESELYQTDKIVAVSEEGEIATAGHVGPSPEILILADSSTPVERVCRPLSELARSGATKTYAGVLTHGSRLATVDIDLIFLSPGDKLKCMILRIDEEEANIEGTPVTNCQDITAFLGDKTNISVKMQPASGVKYSRVLGFAYNLHRAGVRPLLVFGDAPAFSRPSLDELDSLTQSLVSTDEEQQVLAAVKLKTALGELFVYDSSKTPAQNRKTIETWSKWFDKNKPYLYYDTVAMEYAFDAAAATAGVEHKKHWSEKLRILNENNGSK